jgi:hypothetical protein
MLLIVHPPLIVEIAVALTAYAVLCWLITRRWF